MERSRTIEGARIEISDDCVGSSQCVAVAPDVFELGEDGLARLTENLFGGDELELAREAEAVCPSGAISVSPVH
jgi:ferredoxin